MQTYRDAPQRTWQLWLELHSQCSGRVPLLIPKVPCPHVAVMSRAGDRHLGKARVGQGGACNDCAQWSLVRGTHLCSRISWDLWGDCKDCKRGACTGIEPCSSGSCVVAAPGRGQWWVFLVPDTEMGNLRQMSMPCHAG
jgi:hypothetical protein